MRKRSKNTIMEKDDNINIDLMLASLEFPGEAREEIESFLAERDFTVVVMQSIEVKDKRLNKIIFWLVFTFINILLLTLLGTNKMVLKDFFALHDALASLFYLFLGVTLVGGIIGLVIYVDTEQINHIPEVLWNNIAKAKHRFFGR
jgi:hypothetical protein